MLTYIQVEHVGANDNCLELTDVSCQRGKYNSKHHWEFPICPLCRIIVVDASSIFPLCVLHIS